MNLRLSDEWVEPYSMLNAFVDAMVEAKKYRGNPPTEFNIKALPIDEEIEIPKDILQSEKSGSIFNHGY